MDDKLSNIIGVLGAGWLGFPLVEGLLAAGLPVHATSRDVNKREDLRAAGARGFVVDLPDTVPRSFFAGLSQLVITLPPGGRQLKEAATADYLAKLRSILPMLTARPGLRVIYCSSTGVYGAAEGTVTEATPPAPDTHSSRAVLAAEELLADHVEHLTIVRLAGLVGPGRHPGKFFGGKNFPLAQSDAPINLVHGQDAAEALRLLLSHSGATGIFNVCAKAHPAKGNFYGAAAGALGLKTGAKLSGGSAGKVIDSAKIRTFGWQPTHDDLTIFMKK